MWSFEFAIFDIINKAFDFVFSFPNKVKIFLTSFTNFISNQIMLAR